MRSISRDNCFTHLSFRNDQSADLVDRFRLQTTDVVANRLPCEFGVLVPRSDPHNGSQLGVIFGQILNLIVRVVAPETNTGEYQNVPIVHAFAAQLRRRITIDVSANERHDCFSDVGLRIHMLQGSQYRYDGVAASEIQFDLIDRWTVQAKLS